MNFHCVGGQVIPGENADTLPSESVLQNVHLFPSLEDLPRIRKADYTETSPVSLSDWLPSVFGHQVSIRGCRVNS